MPIHKIYGTLIKHSIWQTDTDNYNIYDKPSEIFTILMTVLGKMPAGKMPLGKIPPGKVPPGKLPPGNLPPRKNSPRKIPPPPPPPLPNLEKRIL